ncbi:MAG: choice-of-anchor Q domain-containing protein [Gammaproteobacteria bacterium]
MALTGTMAQAATLEVTKSSDMYDGICDADCSLRDAITAANASPGADTVVLQQDVYLLSIATRQPGLYDENHVDEDENATGDLDITDDLLLRGVQGFTAIDGQRIDRVFDIAHGATVEFRDIEIRGGHTPARGAGIANAGWLRLTRITFRDNAAIGQYYQPGQGGAIFNEGVLSMAGSHFLRNHAGGNDSVVGEGGAIYNTARLNMRTTRFVDNLAADPHERGGGGAIMNRGGFVTIDRTFFSGNATEDLGYGGAIANDDDGRMRIVNSTISGNRSGEPPYGGAVANGNADRRNDGEVTLHFVTLADNDGGGIYNNGQMSVLDSIVGGNYEDYGGDVPDYSGDINCRNFGGIRAAAALMAEGRACKGTIAAPNESFMTTYLYPLGNNGGFAPTHALRYAGHVTLDSARDFEGNCPPTDQRGAPRPADGNYDGVVRCDLGAFERTQDD